MSTARTGDADNNAEPAAIRRMAEMARLGLNSSRYKRLINLNARMPNRSNAGAIDELELLPHAYHARVPH